MESYTVIDREQSSSKEEAEKLMRDIFFCDYFLVSSNAVSEDFKYRWKFQ